MDKDGVDIRQNVCQFHIPVVRWPWIGFPLLLLLQVPNLVRGSRNFGEEWRHLSAWLDVGLSGVVVLLLVFGIRRFWAEEVVTVEGDAIRFQRKTGNRISPPETVTVVTDDQIAFHLFSEKRRISLAKMKVPTELALCLEARVAAET